MTNISGSVHHALVKAWYQKYLGRNPSNEWLEKQVAALKNGHAVEESIRNSDEARRYYTDKVSAAYRNILGRGVDQVGLEGKIKDLQAGKYAVSDLESVLKGSQEYKDKQKKNDSGLPPITIGPVKPPPPKNKDDKTQAWEKYTGKVNEFYKKFLGREAPQERREEYAKLILDKGEDFVKKAIEGSPEAKNWARKDEVTELYKKHLKREPTRDNILHYGAQLNEGKDVDKIIFNSEEAKQRRISHKVLTWGDPDVKKKVKELFNKYLYRNPNENDYKHYGSLYIKQDYGWDGVKNDLTGSPEGQRKNFVVAQYQKYLKRTPSWEEIGKQASFLDSKGFTEEAKKQFDSDLIQSDEYKQLNKDGTEISLGLHKDKFDAADYYERLKPYRNDLTALMEERLDVIYEIDQMSPAQRDAYLADGNRPGQEGGLYESIKKSSLNRSEPGSPRIDGHISTFFGDHSKPGEKAPTTFSDADYLAARAGGQSNYVIYNFMKDHKHTWDYQGAPGHAGRDLYNTIRGGLIQRGLEWGNLVDKDHAETGHSWRNTLENPLWQELGDWLSTKEAHKGKDKKWWRESKDAYKTIRTFLKSSAKHYDWLDAEHGAGLKTDKQLRELIGSSEPGTYRKGIGVEWGEEDTYWEQWGEKGLPDLDDPRDFKGDLSDAQKLGAAIGFGAAASGTAHKDLNLSMTALTGSLRSQEGKIIDRKLQMIEDRFVNELWGTKDKPKDNWKKAEDHWGLDIMRLTDDGKALDFTPVYSTSFLEYVSGNAGITDEFYETLTRGDIDWAYYRNNESYKQAQKALGMDDRIDTVQEIRTANLYVLGHANNAATSKTEGWSKYEWKFDPTTAPAYSNKEIAITGYRPESKDGIKDVREGPVNLKINVAPADIERPDNLPSTWTIQS